MTHLLMGHQNWNQCQGRDLYLIGGSFNVQKYEYTSGRGVCEELYVCHLNLMYYAGKNNGIVIVRRIKLALILLLMPES